MLNDLTDRGIQLRTYSRRDPAPGFSAAKSFDGALRIGPLIVVGNSAAWDTLEIVLKVNGEMRQHLKARECLVKPAEFHHQVFSRSAEAEWVLVATGTPSGTVFKQPGLFAKLRLLLASGFSVRRAKERLLAGMRFLAPGDELVLESTILGVSKSAVVAEQSAGQP
jgi:2-keto-4-pentenoate hydratase/2-oxohepta-3-ene-1,7-dioic acid hydratase in catechol pathway